MAAPLANRFIHLDMEVNVDDWRVWAMNSNIDLSIISFISYRPDALLHLIPTAIQKPLQHHELGLM